MNAKYFGKYPVFFTLLTLLILAFVGGVGFDIWLSLDKSEASARLNRAMRTYRNALGEDPTDKAIKASEENIAKLNARLDFLEKDLTRAGADIFKPLTAKEGYQLVEQLRGMVNTWRREAAKREISVPEDMDFGFKKYVAANAQAPANNAISAIWKQACVLNYINNKLFACKSKESPLSIISVQRELLPVEESTAVSKTKKRVVKTSRFKRDDTKGDNFKIEEGITSRKAGSLDTIAFRFVFAGHTDVLRRFLNQLKDFDAMLVVRSIGVKPSEISAVAAAEENATPPAGGFDAIFGNAPVANAAPTNPDGTPALPPDGNAQVSETPSPDASQTQTGEVNTDSRTPVVTNNISEFTVVIEYVEVVKKDASSKGEDVGQKNATAKK